MEVSPSRHSTQSHLRSTGTSSPSMQAAIPLRPSNAHSPGVMTGQEPRSHPERVELPSIRQAVPEIINNQVSGKTAVSEYRSDGISYSPKAGSGVSNTPDHPASPSYKRRRLSSEEDQDLEFRERTGSKRYRSPSAPTQRSQSVTISPTSSVPQSNALSSAESWTSSGRSSPYLPPRGYPGIRSPPFDTSTTFEPPTINRADWRPTLPSLPDLTLGGRGPSQVLRGRTNEYALDSSRSGARTYPQMLTSAFDPPISSYHQPAFSYGYQQPRVQSYSGLSGHSLSHDRTPFSIGHRAMYPGSSFPYGMSDSGQDSKQRKRRGNLPKETTDKLRNWFVSHLQHPYPTEDEKQDLMRQTGLQINQISNWFINARRRQLPNMISNARAESDARAAREGDGNAVGENTSDYGEEKQSEGEGSGYDDDFDGIRSRHALQISKRESI